MRQDWFVTVATVVAVALSGSGCRNLSAACEGIGICDASPPAPLAIDILCDSSGGSTCTRDAIADTLDDTLPLVAERPSSTLRLWAMGATVDEVVTLGIVTSTELPAATRAREAAEEAFLKAEKARLLASAVLALAHPAPQSPIADALARVLMAAVNEHRFIVVISDMREFEKGGFDFECGVLPSPMEFAKGLDRTKVVGPNAMKGVSVAFTFVGVPAIDGSRCAATIPRARVIEAIWRTFVTSGGGTVLAYTDGPVRLSDLLQKRSDQ